MATRNNRAELLPLLRYDEIIEKNGEYRQVVFTLAYVLTFKVNGNGGIRQLFDVEKLHDSLVFFTFQDWWQGSGQKLLAPRHKLA